jgi:hypothetical protein
VGARFSAPVQTGPGAHPASCTMWTGSFPGVKRGRGVTLTPHPLLVSWSTPPVGCTEPHCLFKGTVYLYLNSKMAGLKIWDSVSEKGRKFYLRTVLSTPTLEPTSYALCIGNSFTGVTLSGSRSFPFTSDKYRCSVRAASSVKLAFSYWRGI